MRKSKNKFIIHFDTICTAYKEYLSMTSFDLVLHSLQRSICFHLSYCIMQWCSICLQYTRGYNKTKIELFFCQSNSDYRYKIFELLLLLIYFFFDYGFRLFTLFPNSTV